MHNFSNFHEDEIQEKSMYNNFTANFIIRYRESDDIS